MRMYKVDKSGADFNGTPWHARLLILWEEDDARAPGRETGQEALKRLSGNSHLLPRARYNPEDDDWVCTLYDRGWVLGATCEGAFVGVVVKEQGAGKPKEVREKHEHRVIKELVGLADLGKSSDEIVHEIREVLGL